MNRINKKSIRRITGAARTMLCLLLCINLLHLIPSSVRAQSLPSEDIPGEIITLSTAEDFLQFAESCRLDSYSMGLTVQLACDIDLSGCSFEPIPSFSGTFEGGGHTVSGVFVTTNGSVQGLFRYLRGTAVVRDLTVEGEITPGGSHNNVGGLAGRNAGLIENCRFSGQVSGSEQVGGLVGLNELTGIIDSCTTAGNIHGDHFVGGTAGDNKGVIRDCINMAQVNATAAQNSVEIGDITLDSLTGSEAAGTATDIGGIAGTSSGVIRGCHNQGVVGYPHIGYNVGGIAGSQIGYITDCENSGDIYGRKEAGGIVGQMEPSTIISYHQDALQMLHSQLAAMSSTMNSAASVLQNGTEQLSSQTGELQGHIDSAFDAMGQLVPDGSGAPPDSDSTIAALNNLNGAMSSINGTVSGMAATGEDSVSALTNKLGTLLDQINGIGATIGGASENVGGTVIDISDADTDADTSGKVENCVNNGSVDADINAGGIVGAMSVENDLDPDDDLASTGNTSMNFDCELRAVVLRCENNGAVTVKRQNAGGVAGWITLGLLRECTNTGAVNSPAAKYIGGIAGQSSGYIRDCGAKCLLGGAGYVGGIAGQSNSTVTDCMSMVRLLGASEKQGAVLGYSEDVAAGRGDVPVSGNYYCVIDRDIGGVDGISYHGAAQAMNREDFLAGEELPDIFKSVTVRFVFESGSAKSIVLSPGDPLAADRIPPIPEKAGYAGYWGGLDQLDLSMVAFDAELDVVYELLDSTVQSDALRESGSPVLLALGSFGSEPMLKAEQIKKLDTVYDGQQPIEGWKFEMTDGTISQLRYRLPEGSDAKKVLLSVSDGSGEWENRSFSADGSYLVFAVEDGESMFRLDSAPPDMRIEYAIVGGSLLLIIIAAACMVIGRRKKAQ